MAANGKRKYDASGAQGSRLKKSKGGSGGKWMTPSHKAKLAAIKGRTLEVGDAGFWVTCQRHKEMRAADEMLSICEDYGEKLFGIKPDQEQEQEQEEDIETAIAKELAALKRQKKNPATPNTNENGGGGGGGPGPFDLLRMNIDCVLFVRTRPPVDPCTLIREICKDAAAASDRSLWRSRFINKLTPISLTGRATERGLEEVAAKVLPEHFVLAEGEKKEEAGNGDGDGQGEGERGACSYAIRPSVRSHNTLKRGEVIDKVAKMISKRHKVDLKNPDKVIIIEIFQTFLGMSVVGNDWEAMKRYNIHELYSAAAAKAATAGSGDPGGKQSEEEEKEKESEEKTPA